MNIPFYRRSVPAGRRRLLRHLAFVLVATVVLTAWQQGDLPFGVEPGQRAPYFTLVDRDGAAISNRDFLGEPLLINFWATWCVPCRAELPLFQRAAEESGVRVLLINLSEPADDVHAFFDEVGISLPLARDASAEEQRTLAADGIETLPSGAVFNVYRAFGLPTSYFVDDAGVVRAVQVGEMAEPTLVRNLATIGVDWLP